MVNNVGKDQNEIDQLGNEKMGRGGKRGGAVQGVGVCGEVVFEEKLDYI